MKPWSRWQSPRTCTIPFPAPTREASSAAVRKPTPCLAASPNEDGATIDGILTFGLIWLQHTRDRARRYSVHGLRLFLPRGSSAITAHRMAALASPQEVELYEYEPLYWRVRRIARSDAGNLATWIVPRREIEQAIAAAMPLAERIRRLAPEAIRVGVAPATQEVTLRFRGLEFARWRLGAMWYGLGDHQESLTPEKWPALEALVRQLETHRHPLASDTKHRLYRAQPERWLETMVAADPARIDARLDPRHIYTQVPAFSSGDRGIIDLLGVTRDGRLAVLELKASEDIQLVMQAVDYWLRVRWHHEQDDFRRYGYFPEVPLEREAPAAVPGGSRIPVPSLYRYRITILIPGNRSRAHRAGGKLAPRFARGFPAIRTRACARPVEFLRKRA